MRSVRLRSRLAGSWSWQTARRGSIPRSPSPSPTLIVVGVVRIVREATDVLLESAPAHASIPAVREQMQALPGVVDVHDLHVWTIGSGSHVLTAHVLLADARISEASDERIVCTQTERRVPL